MGAAAKHFLLSRILGAHRIQPNSGLADVILKPRVARSSQPWAEGFNPVGISELSASPQDCFTPGASSDSLIFNHLHARVIGSAVPQWKARVRQLPDSREPSPRDSAGAEGLAHGRLPLVPSASSAGGANPVELAVTLPVRSTGFFDCAPATLPYRRSAQNDPCFTGNVIVI